MTLRYMIVDDCERFLQVARAALEHDGLEIVGVATDSAQAMERMRELRPDVMLIDVCLGEECGIALSERIAECAGHRPSVILISTYDDADLEELVASGPAVAYVSKCHLTGEVVRAITDGRVR